jgi:hypothetical protein
MISALLRKEPKHVDPKSFWEPFLGSALTGSAYSALGGTSRLKNFWITKALRCCCGHHILQNLGVLASTLSFTSIRCLMEFRMCRQYVAVDIVLRSGTGQVIQFFSLRSDTDQACGGENTTVKFPEMRIPLKFGTIMKKKFLHMVVDEELRCPELGIDDASHSSLAQETHEKFVEIESTTIYSTGRYIIRDEGKMSKEQLGQNSFLKDSTVK